MTVAEALSDFQKVLNNPNSTFDDLSQIVKEISVFDNVAPDDAVTHFYILKSVGIKISSLHQFVLWIIQRLLISWKRTMMKYMHLSVMLWIKLNNLKKCSELIISISNFCCERCIAA